MRIFLKVFYAVAAVVVVAVLLIVLYLASYRLLFRMNVVNYSYITLYDSDAQEILRRVYAPAHRLNRWFTRDRPYQKYMCGYWVSDDGDGGDEFLEIARDRSCRFNLYGFRHDGEVVYVPQIPGYRCQFSHENEAYQLTVTLDFRTRHHEASRQRVHISVHGMEPKNRKFDQQGELIRKPK